MIGFCSKCRVVEPRAREEKASIQSVPVFSTAVGLRGAVGFTGKRDMQGRAEDKQGHGGGVLPGRLEIQNNPRS